MECNRARQLAEFVRPGVCELDAADRSALEDHLRDCPDCGPVVRIERRDDERLAVAMRSVAIPGPFVRQLHARLLAARIRWWRLRIVGGATMVIAAALLIALTSHLLRPTFDPNAIAMSTYEMSGQGRSADDAQAVATAWLREVDRRLAAPPDWNYRLLAFAAKSDFAGLSGVPMLVLTRGEATARIYAVRETALKNLTSLDQPLEEGGSTIVLRRYPESPGWAFIAVISGAPIDGFLRTPVPANPA